MSRKKLFIENILVYGFGGMLAKLVPFIMLPIVTRLMPETSYYGLSDLSNTLVSFAQAFAVMGMYDATFRMFFEKEDEQYKKEICSTSLYFVTGMALVVAICLLLLQDPISIAFFGGTQYASLVVVSAVSTFLGGNNSIVEAPTRMQNKRFVFIVMNLVTAVLSYSIAIPILLNGEYLLALPVAGALASAMSLIVFGLLNRKWFNPKMFKKEHLKILVMIGLPLMPNFLVYWVFNSASRIMIVNFLGASEAGVFAIAAKLGQISQLIYTAFAQGWQYFAFSTMKDDDQTELTGRVFEYLAFAAFSASAIFIALCPFLYQILFEPVYYSGRIAAPYLFIAPLLLMLFQVGTNQFIVIKKTWPNLLILGLGAVVNVALGWVLIPAIGIEGAGIATLVGYMLSVIVCIVVLLRMNLVELNPRVFATAVLFASFFALWRLLFMSNFVVVAFMTVVLLVVFGCLYRRELHDVIRKIVLKFKKLNSNA